MRGKDFKSQLEGKSVILLDAGNTLVTIDFFTVSKILKNLGINADPERMIQLEYEARSHVDHPAVIQATKDDNRWIRHYTVILEGVGVCDKTLQWEVLGRLKEEHQRLNLWRSVAPTTPSVLMELKRRGYRLALVSNADGRIESLMEEVGLRPHLEICVDSGIEGIEKPDPRLFQVALDRMGVTSQECVYVGDLYHVDVTGARMAKIVPILIDPGDRHADVDVLCIKTLDELLDFFPPLKD